MTQVLRLSRLLALLLLLSAGALTAVPAAGAIAQSSAAPAPDFAAPTQVAFAQAPEPAQIIASPTAQQRSMRHYWHVFIAYAVTLLLVLGYVVSMGRRYGSLVQELNRLTR